MQNGDVYEANIKDIDKKSDIATIKVNPQVSRPATCLATSNNEVFLRTISLIVSKTQLDHSLVGPNCPHLRQDQRWEN